MRRLLLVVVLLLAACGSDEGAASPTTTAADVPQIGDHFHDSFGLFVCDSYIDRTLLRDNQADEAGIHSHADGLIHVHPFQQQFTGAGAVLGLYLEMVGISVRQGVVTVPSGQRIGPQSTCTEGGPAVEVRLVVDGEDVDGDPMQYRLRPDQAIVLAVVPPGTEVPPLPWATQRATDV